MSGYAFNAFAGEIPRVSPRLLDQRNAAAAENVQVFSGELNSWRRPLRVAGVTKLGAAVKSIYRMSDGAEDFWLNWITDVDVMLSPLAGDTTGRIYYTGDGSPKKTNLALATSGTDLPTACYEMGVPAPTAPTVTVGSAGAGPTAARTWLVTFVNVWGEEGPPSPVSATGTIGPTGFSVTLSALDTGKKAVTSITRVGNIATVNLPAHGFRDASRVNIAGATQPEYNGGQIIKLIDADNFSFIVIGTPVTPATGTITAAGNYGLTARRIYRNLVSSSGVSNWQFVAEQDDLTVTTYTDTTPDTSLGDVITTITVGQTGSGWTEPPAAMIGLTELPGNGAAGFVDNVLCFAEPGSLHAWPVRYQINFTNKIVNIKTFGSTIVVATEGIPYTVTGSHPANMQVSKVEDWKEPCTSKRGMVDGPGGVYYPSPNGLIGGGLQGFSNLSTPYFVGGPNQSWQQQAFPDTLLAVIFDGRYYGFFTSDNAQGGGFIMPKSGDPPGMLFHNQYVTAAMVDRSTGRFYIVQGSDILEWDADPNNLIPFTWLSKLMSLPMPVNFGAYAIEADYSLLDDEKARAAAAAADAAYNAGVVLTEGELNSVELNGHDLNGSLLRGGDTPSFDSRYLTFTTYAEVKDANGNDVLTLIDTIDVTSKTMDRLTDGFKSDLWQFGLTGNIPVQTLKCGETPKDLKTI